MAKRLLSGIVSFVEAGDYRKDKWIDADPFEEDVREYRNKVFKPILHRREKYTVLVVGKQGAGKSSFVTSVLTNSEDQDYVTRYAAVGVDDYSFSLKVMRYNVSEHLDIIDTPGYNEGGKLDSDHDSGFTLEKITEIMDGRVESNSKMNAKSVEQNKPEQSVDSVVLVLDITTERTDGNQLMSFYKSIIHRCKERRIGFCVALTKVDNLCSQLDWVFYHKDVGKKVKEIADMIGILPTFILPIKNYTGQRGRSKNIDLLVLDCMKIVLQNTMQMAKYRN